MDLMLAPREALVLACPGDVKERIAHVDNGQRRCTDDDAAHWRADLHLRVVIGIGDQAEQIAFADGLTDSPRAAKIRRGSAVRGVDSRSA